MESDVFPGDLLKQEILFDSWHFDVRKICSDVVVTPL